MRLLSASALWWLLIGAIIILFYLLKLKRKRRVVPSVFLWQRALEEIEANAPFKKLRRSLLLILQLAALSAIVFALARPLIATRSLASGSSIIIIDSTASMSARDENGRSRLDRAKELARDMVSGLSGDDRAAIIESSSRVTVRSSLTSDRAALQSAINYAEETDAQGNLTDAVRLAEQIAKTERDARIIVISDGGSPPLATDLGSNALGSDGLGSRSAGTAAGNQSASGSGAGLRFVRVGQRADNVGIVAMNSRATQSGARRELFASIANFGANDRSIAVELKINGNLADARTVNVAANDRAALVFNSLPDEGGLAELKLDLSDDLASDNTAYAFLNDARPIRVGVASENPFLLASVAVNTDFDARKINPGVALSEFDCIVSDGPLPAGAVESNRPLLAINPSDEQGLWRATGTEQQPEITLVERSHPVNNYLSYADLHIESAPRRETAPWIRPVAASAEGGLIWAGDDSHRRVVMIGFDLAQSDLPLKVEFPLLLANSIAWLAGRDQAAAERTVRAGQPAIINGAQASATITKPNGESEEATARDGSIIFADTFKVGAYGVKDAQGFAASLLSESESNTAPRDSIKTRAGEISGQVETFKSEREAWRWIALAALAVLTFEWWVYHRRIA
jgi:VWA domain-containing protein/aerotolerance regulator-like protein